MGNYDHSLCISQFSQNEFLELYPDVKSTNIGAGISADFAKLLKKKPVSVDSTIGEGFVLYVGGNDWRKNVSIIGKAFSRLPDSLRQMQKFVMVGLHDADLLNVQQRHWAELGLPPENFIHVGNASDSQLVQLYRSASVLIQPSYMEGFGLTALEALAAKTPVLAANAGALPEVVQSEDLLFDPSSSKALAVKLEAILCSPNTQKSALAEARKKSLKFTWKNSAKVTLEALSSISMPGSIRPGLNSSRRALSKEIRARKLASPAAALMMAANELKPENPKRLLIEATCTAIVDHKTGIQRVVKKSVDAMMRFGEDSIRIVFCDADGIWLDCEGSIEEKPDPRNAMRLEQHSADTLLMLDSSWGHDQVHRSKFLEQRLRGGEVIFCLYDMVPLTSYAFCDPGMPIAFSRWFRTALQYATGFVCISKAVADEFLQVLEAIEFPRSLKVGYWQLGADFSLAPQISNDDRDSKKNSIMSFLMVGTIEPRKGHVIALDAFDELWDLGFDLELIIVGKPGWANEHLIERIEEHPLFGTKLIWHRGVSDEGLSNLYTRSDALVAASFAEGFGLPLVEAGHFGKPAIVSDIPVFREVGKGAAGVSFFQVGDSDDLANKIIRFIKTGKTSIDNSKYEAWPTWDESAQQLREVVEGQNWYRTYKPAKAISSGPLEDIGNTRMTRPLESLDLHYEVVEGPIRRSVDGLDEYILKVENRSSQAYSSHGRSDGTLGINLSAIVRNSETNAIVLEGQRCSIPFVFPSNSSQFVRLKIESTEMSEHEVLEFTGVQEGVAWF